MKDGDGGGDQCMHVCMDAYFWGPIGNVLPISSICKS